MDILTADSLAEEAKKALVAREDGIALELVSRILEFHPEHGQGLQVRAILALRGGRLDEAIEASFRALSAIPSDPGALNVSASALRLAQRYSEAEELLREALRLAPQLAETHLNLALTMMDSGRQAKAETYFRNVIALRNDSDRAYFYLGKIAFENGRLEESIDFLRSALQLSPRNPDVRRLLVEALVGNGRTEESLSEIDAWREFGVFDISLFSLAARIHFELAEVDDAALNLAQWLSRSEDHTAKSVPRAARLGLIDMWCSRNEAPYFRAARAQWLKFGTPTVYPKEEETAFECPRPHSRELFLASIPDVRVLPGDLLLLTADNEVLAEGVLNNVQQRLHSSRLVRSIADDGRVLLQIPEAQIDLQESACYLGTADNYFSWVYECLGRMWIIDQRPDLARQPLLVSDELSRRQTDLLSLLGVGEGRLARVPRDKVVRCNLIHVPANPVVGWFVAPMAVEYLRRSIRRHVASTRQRRRLYLSSATVGEGRVANEEGIWPLLRKKGFERIMVSELATEELCSLMAQAEVVIGATSDAMALFFMLPAGAAVCVLLPRGMLSPKLFCASATLSVTFTYIVCEPDFQSSDRLDRCDIIVSEILLTSFLADLKL